MMLFHLIKKDVLIVKKYVLIMLAAAVLIPPFYALARACSTPGFWDLCCPSFLRVYAAAICIFERISNS